SSGRAPHADRESQTMARPPAGRPARVTGRGRHGRARRVDARPRRLEIDGRDRRPGRGRGGLLAGGRGVDEAVTAQVMMVMMVMIAGAPRPTGLWYRAPTLVPPYPPYPPYPPPVPPSLKTPRSTLLRVTPYYIHTAVR